MITQWHMTIFCNIEPENNLFAVGPEIFIMAMTNSYCPWIRTVILTHKG